MEDINEIHKVQAEMLKEVTDFLKKNKLKYFLDYGTLLGAVRHKGFIPWDDDVDISMTREEYNKLIDLAKKNNKINDYLFITSSELNNSPFPFCKVYNKRIRVEEEFVEVDEGEYLWIDVFPYDLVTEDNNYNCKIHRKILFLHKLWGIRIGNYKKVFKFSRNAIYGILKMCLKIFINILPISYYAKKMQEMSQINNFDKKDQNLFYQNILWTPKFYYPVSKNELENLIDLEFEGEKYSALKSYDNHLRMMFGDYMKLPPEDKRDTHLKKIWKVD